MLKQTKELSSNYKSAWRVFWIRDKKFIYVCTIACRTYDSPWLIFQDGKKKAQFPTREMCLDHVYVATQINLETQNAPRFPKELTE